MTTFKREVESANTPFRRMQALSKLSKQEKKNGPGVFRFAALCKGCRHYTGCESQGEKNNEKLNCTKTRSPETTGGRYLVLSAIKISNEWLCLSLRIFKITRGVF